MKAVSSDTGWFVTAFTACVVVFVLAPIVIVLAMSVSDSELAIFPPSGFSLRWYDAVLSEPDFIKALGLSASIAALATSASLVLGIPASIGLVRYPFPGSRVVQNVLLLPLVFPGLITGLALLKLFALAGSYDAFLNLLLAHVLVTFPYVLRTVTASLVLVDTSLEEAARTLGASQFGVFRHVTLPQIMPGIFAGVIFAFITSFDNFVVSLWLSGAGTVPLPILVFQHLATAFDPSVAAEASVMVAIGALAVVLLEWSVGLRRTAAH
ncbi:hypothetical protein UP09_05460 [Bradyrhizobium sp. LTSP885]|uniref:ABC transporter permease n=1 Tax=Bradyrhizobium sp. LTSP885 TaxID=1619232 RepID=UPI0005CB63BB|nr:ABC transporter permease [Bradyrhizobium sp. LTSP885]KJC50542.1 hypothetical protein UP09_05460 [Bradyrhizobium sp. LTSP885]